MPASPATPRRSSKNRRSTPVIPARHDATPSMPLELSDSNSVRDRIRQWQEQGAKFVSAPALGDISISGDENAEVGKPTSPPKREKGVARAADTTPRRRSRRWVDPENKEWIREARSSSTPRKRVVSDENWKKKKKRSPQSTEIASRQETKQEKPRSDSAGHTLSKKERFERPRRRKHDRSSTTSGAIYDENAEREPETLLPSSRSCRSKEEPIVQSNPDSGMDDDLPRTSRRRVSAAPSGGGNRKSPDLSHQTDGKLAQLGQYPKMVHSSAVAVPDSSDVAANKIRTRKSGFISQAKVMFSRTEPVEPASQRLPSIEAWLDEQPDPFTDDNPEPVEIPAPLKTQSHKHKLDVSPKHVEDPNNIWTHVNSEDPKQHQPLSSGNRGRRKSRRSQDAGAGGSLESADTPQLVEKTQRFSSSAQNSDDSPKDASVTGLKRRGARAMRVRAGTSPVKRMMTEYDSKAMSRASVGPEKFGADVALPTEEHPKSVRPCPPTGIHRLSTIASVETFQSQIEAKEGVNILAGDGNGLQRRLTTHEDLMSVLSRPRAGGSIKSARSVRTAKSRTSAATLDEVFEELEVDEAKYMRELKTLVDGVIPVLLQCVLSKTDAAAAAGLFSSSGSARDDLNFTKPIIDMGVALERLKTLHRRIPIHDLTSLLSWAQSARKVYLEYLSAWRLGFQDVIVNLAHPDDHPQTDIDEGMARDENGDVVNSNGEKVDVAYLLKRPLVRIKNLAKVFARIRILKPSSKASMVADEYDDLIKTARRRSNEEQSRLEDEAAANIDASKARDVQTLAVLSGVKVDRSRRVRARDCFSLTVHHSSGQRLDCHIELLLRDNQTGPGTGGDLLICEVEDNGKWLLFPPLEVGLVSARHGDNDGETVLMVRGHVSYGLEWHELFLLTTSDIEAASEWVDMLGTQPLPPKLDRTSSFINRQKAGAISLQQDSAFAGKRLPLIPRSPSPQEVQVPIGEPSVIADDGCERPGTARSVVYQHEQPSQSESGIVSPERSLPRILFNNESKATPVLPQSSPEDEQPTSPHTPFSDTSSPRLGRATYIRKRQSGRRESDHSSPLFPSSPTHSTQPGPSTGTGKINRTDNASREWMSSPDVQRATSKDGEGSSNLATPQHDPYSKPQRPQYHRAISSAPSKELPTIHRLRESSPVSAPLIQSALEQSSSLSGIGTKSEQGIRPTKADSSEGDIGSRISDPGEFLADDVVRPAPHHARTQSPPLPLEPAEARPVPPPHRSSPQQERAKPAPFLKLQPQPTSRIGRRDDRRSSSPLKHEYAPSTASGSDESDDESIASSSSETSEEGVCEQRDRLTPLPPLDTTDLRTTGKVSPPASLPNLPGGTLAPSNSASQAPYRTVPHVALQRNAPAPKAIATVCSWSDKGMWQSLYPDECSIVVSPGLIEAYEMSAAHSGARATNDDGTVSEESSYAETTDDRGIRPLVGFELTPLVPLRRGTALDISIRSPPTARSKVKASTNVMFRSRNAEECEALYAMINHARINNPTWIALQNARPREMPDVTFNTGPGSARHSRSRSKSGSWFGFSSQGKKSSYRASSAPLSGSPSIGGKSETSVGSMSSALSALRRFSGGASGGKGMFNLNRSSVIRRKGRFGTSGSASLYSSSSVTTRTGGSGSGATSPAPSHVGRVPPASDQTAAPVASNPGGTVNNMKIRLYVRESAARWRDLGAARLSVMPAPVMIKGNADSSNAATDNDPSPPGTAAVSRPASTFMVGQAGQASGPRLPSSNHTPHRVHGNGNEKRIVVTGKTKGETLLDATLHESCFERIARTGIAVSVWEEHEEVAKSGGVVGGRGRTYMVQMKGEAEAAWVFGMVGRLRY